MRAWVSPQIRDDVVEFVQRYAEKTGLSRSSLIARSGIGRDKFYDWRRFNFGKSGSGSFDGRVSSEIPTIRI